MWRKAFAGFTAFCRGFLDLFHASAQPRLSSRVSSHQLLIPCLNRYLIEFAFRLLPPNKTPKICIIADANFLKLQQINIGYIISELQLFFTFRVAKHAFDCRLMKGMLKILTKGYPDCLGGVSAGPVNRFLTTIFSLLKPAMPARLVSKINLLRNPAMNLLDVLEEKDVPTHLGGSAVHDFRGMTGEYDFRCMLRRHKELSRLGSPH